jgi:peptide/nickel transport system ATP-binding protein/oligopeptide transport system ATP-binding protein
MSSADGQQAILSVDRLTKHFDLSSGLIDRLRGHRPVAHAVNSVSFDIAPRRTLGLVGESGCGKTTVGKTIMRLYDPTSGQILFRGQDVAKLKGRGLKEFRRHAQMVFQDPESSLNRRKTVEQILAVPLIVHGLAQGKERSERIEQVLEQVGLEPRYKRRFPHEFSGGQRQRIGIARALISQPSLIIADEPVSALDVSTQAQIVNLLSDLQSDFNLSFLFITHDLSVVKHISQDVAVMYLGEIMETGPTRTVFDNPAHPYTQALLSAVPQIDRSAEPGQKRQRIILSGEVPSLVTLPSGCVFHTRCPQFIGKICEQEVPQPRDIGSGHVVRCHLYNDIGTPVELKPSAAKTKQTERN